VWKPVGKFHGGQANELERASRRAIGIILVDKCRDESDVLKDSPVRQQPAVLLHIADSSAQLYGRFAPHIVATDFDVASIWFYQPIEAA
jgi:hypothetical protein